MWTDTRGILEKGERIIPRSGLVFIALLLFFIAGIGSVQAALTLQVTVTANPSTLRPGGAEAQITVLVKTGSRWWRAQQSRSAPIRSSPLSIPHQAPRIPPG